MRLTSIVIALVVASLIGYDVWTAIEHGGPSTISWTLWTLAKGYPVIPFAIGFVMGHLFWVQQSGDPSNPTDKGEK